MENRLSAAIVFLPREGALPSVMLKDILFDPAARWLSESLRRAGVCRFLVACHQEDRAGAEACFPEGTRIVTTGGEDASGALEEFLKENAGRVAVVTQPVYLDTAAQERLAQGRTDLTAQERGEFVRQGAEIKGCGVFELTQEGREAILGGAELSNALAAHGREYRGLGPSCRVTREGLLGPLQGAARMETVLRLQAGGVQMVDPMAVYAGPQVEVGRGTVLLPGVILRGETVIGENCQIGPNSLIRDSQIGRGVTVNSSQVNESVIEDDTTVGPFAYVRPNTHVGPGCRVGDFVELKNSTIGAGTKISHLTYVGDSDVGSHINFGCGTVTVNYDGSKKFRTKIGDGAFIGCNANLVAPVEIGEGAYIAAGSTITKDVPADSLAIARSLQTVKNQWAKKRRGK